MRTRRLPAAQRLRLQADFERVRQQGLRAVCGYFVLNARRDPDAASAGRAVRFAVVTAKRLLGDAVWRNRMRRVFKEIFRLHPGVWDVGWDVVVVPRRQSLSGDFASLEKQYLDTSARLLKTKPHTAGP
ncbi:MAG: ribonuclease P protein component [Puniceicoccales bacterium]|jgi:ribonuclease P protein component|nr:ribonuclease P protein component [Puniceicoccales bacterium]